MSKSEDKITLEKIIRTALLVPMGNPERDNCHYGLPLLLWGDPGIGKSARIKAAGDMLSLQVETVYPATRAPEDFSGAPFIKGEKISIECILGAVRDLCETGTGILFIDEISCAVPAVQAALLSVVLERKVGDTKLPPGIRILSAANPPSVAAGGWDLAPPMANRFAHINFPAPANYDWTGWLLNEADEEVETNNIFEAQEVIKNGWKQYWMKAAGLVAGYMKSTGKVYDLPAVGHHDRGRAWPSPRTWEMATRAIATCEILGESFMSTTMVQACVGEGQAAQWSTWVKEADLPDAKTMCTEGWKPDKRRIDKTVAALNNMVGFVLSRNNKEQKFQMAVGAWKVLRACDEAGQLDLAYPLTYKLIKAGLGVTSESKDVKEACAPVVRRLSATQISRTGGQIE